MHNTFGATNMAQLMLMLRCRSRDTSWRRTPPLQQLEVTRLVLRQDLGEVAIQRLHGAAAVYYRA
jgi:hypothetical protein